jgi:beta-galactosidase
MYHTTKNHPSVAMFSLAQRSANGINLYESYLALKALEPDRPVVYTDGGGEWNSDRLGMSAEGRRGEVEGASKDPVGLDAVDVTEGRFKVRNYRKITPLTGQAIYKIVVGKRKVVSTGSLPIEALPGETTEFTVPIAGVKPGKPYTVAIEIAVESPTGEYLPADDPNLKVFRRLDQPLAPAARTVILAKEFKSAE